MAFGAALFAVGCEDEGETKTIYTVEVIGGTGSGFYYEGDVCKVTASVPDGKAFLKWTANDADVSGQEEYVFTVTEDVEVVAVFGDAEAADGKEVYFVTTQDENNTPHFAYGEGGYLEGSKCTVTLAKDEAGRDFKGWAKVDSEGNYGEILSNKNPYTFDVTEDTALVALFNDVRIETPLNAENQMIKIYKPDYSDLGVELDRQKDGNGGAITIFDERVDYVKVYIYTSQTASESVAQFKFEQIDGTTNIRFTTFAAQGEEGYAEYTNFLGEPGNYYQDRIDVAAWYAFFKTVIGEQYSENASYYFAVQAIAVDEPLQTESDDGTVTETKYADSKISAIGSAALCEKPL